MSRNKKFQEYSSSKNERHSAGKKKEEKTELKEETDESKTPRKGRMKICRTLNVDK